MSLLGGLPSLTHIALPRKANANEDNDVEFINDLRTVAEERACPFGSLQSMVLVVEPYTGMQMTVPREDQSAEDDFEPHHSTHIWKRMSEFAGEVNSEASYGKGKPMVCVVPGSGGAWQRALSKNRQIGGMFDSNVYSSAPRGQSLWSWARDYECRRRWKEMIPPVDQD